MKRNSRFWHNRRERAEGIEILRKAGVSLIATKGPSLDMSTAYGRGMVGLRREFDTMESEVKAEREQLAAFHRAENGQPPAGVRLTGYTMAGVVVEHEAAVVRQMFTFTQATRYAASSPGVRLRLEALAAKRGVSFLSGLGG